MAVSAVAIVLCVVILFAWSSDRQRKELLWLAALLATRAFEMLWQFTLTNLESHPWSLPSSRLIASALPAALLAEFLMAALQARAPLWVRVFIWLPSIVLLGFAGQDQLFQGLAMPMAIPVLVVLFWPWRRSETDLRPAYELVFYRVICGGILLNLLIANFGLLPLLGMARNGGGTIRTWDVTWPIYPVSLVLFSLGTMLVLLRRMVLDRQEKQRLAGELEAASVVQRLMLSSQEERAPGLSIDAVYRPALEVGGDFYYVTEDGDARVLVTGDVSGKGLKAALLVALVIGALRETREREAGAVLGTLNRVLSGQMDGGFVTAVVARFEGNRATIASAGHPAAWKNGVEAPVDAGLPSGWSRKTSGSIRR